MKLHLVGFEVTEGTSKKTGLPYAIGKLHAVLPLAPAFNKDGSKNVAKGHMGSEYRCDVSILRKIEHLTPSADRPLLVEVEQQDVMRFGERKQEIVSIVPVALAGGKS